MTFIQIFWTEKQQKVRPCRERQHNILTAGGSAMSSPPMAAQYPLSRQQLKTKTIAIDGNENILPAAPSKTPYRHQDHKQPLLSSNTNTTAVAGGRIPSRQRQHHILAPAAAQTPCRLRIFAFCKKIISQEDEVYITFLQIFWTEKQQKVRHLVGLKV